MKRSFICFISAIFLFASCNTATPENYFDKAVLNTNMMMGFGTNGMKRQLENGTAKMDPVTTQATPVKSTEALNSTITFLEDAVKKIRSLKETADTKEMLQASIALHEYVIPVYKNEYMQLAKMYDEGKPSEETDAFAESINNKYYPRFDELVNKLTAIGKVYAAKHNITVNWGN